MSILPNGSIFGGCKTMGICMRENTPHFIFQFRIQKNLPFDPPSFLPLRILSSLWQGLPFLLRVLVYSFYILFQKCHCKTVIPNPRLFCLIDPQFTRKFISFYITVNIFPVHFTRLFHNLTVTLLVFRWFFYQIAHAFRHSPHNES